MSATRKDDIRPVDFKQGCVDLSRGGGGRAMVQLVDELFQHAFDNEWLRQRNDQARFSRAARAPGDGHRQPRRLAAVLPRRPCAPWGPHPRQRHGPRMRRNFYGFDPSYHVARSTFVRRVAPSWTPRHLTLHRQPSAARASKGVMDFDKDQ